MVIISYLFYFSSLLFLKNLLLVHCRYAQPDRPRSVSSSELPKYQEKMPSKDVQEWVDKLVHGHKVVVFSKSYCPYSVRAKEALKKLNLKDLHVEELENHPKMQEVQEYLCNLSGGSTVPRVFVNGKFYGDSSKTVADVDSGAFMDHYRKTEL